MIKTVQNFLSGAPYSVKCIFPGMLFLVSIISNLSAQDADFSQLFPVPQYLNPALTGSYDGNYRIGMVYRDQWGGMINDPFKTFAVSGDTKIEIGDKYRSKDFIAAGLMFVGDKVSTFDFSTNSISLSLAFHKHLDWSTETYISAGFIAGISQKNFTYENFVFQDQFNGIDGFTFSSDEILPRNNHAFADIGVGVNLNSTVSRTFRYNAGLGYFHVTGPNISFYQEIDSEEFPEVLREVNLESKLSAHAHFDVQLISELSLRPGLLYIRQGNHNQFRLGTGSKWILSDVQENAFHLGGWFRMANDVEGFGLHSFILMAGFEYKRLLVGLSYDLSIQDITSYGVGQHVFEISFSYIGQYEDDSVFCPRF